VLWKQYNRRREPAEEEATDTHNGSVEFLFVDSLLRLNIPRKDKDIILIIFILSDSLTIEMLRYKSPEKSSNEIV